MLRARLPGIPLLLPSRSSPDLAVTVAAPFPPPLTLPAVMLVLFLCAWAGTLGKAQLLRPLPMQAGFLMEKHAKMFSLHFRHFNRLLVTRGSPALLPGPKALKQAENRPVTSFVQGQLCSLISLSDE